MPSLTFESVLDLIGDTPLVRLSHVVPQGAAAVWGKLEAFNPGGSVKDRICRAMIEDAEARGILTPDSLVVEPTSGNTGIGLALVCAVKGYKLVLTMPESMSLERRALLAAFGAEVVLTPAEEGIDGAIAAAEAILSERPGAWMPNQFANPANPRVHRDKTVHEILEAMGGDPIDAFVAGVGTGGTVSGVGAVLKQKRPSVRVIAVEPASSPVLSGGEAGPTKIQGLGAGFVPDVFDRAVVDEIRAVADRPAWEMKRRLAREEGILCGMSSGAAVVVALDVARALGEGKNVVVVLPDTGERYFSLDEYFT